MDITPVVTGGQPRPVPTSPPPRRSEVRAALKDSAGVGLGFLPLGLAFGALVTQSGLDWWWAGLSAALVFGGSFEFLLIGMVTASAPLAAIAVSALLVNVRQARLLRAVLPPAPREWPSRQGVQHLRDVRRGVRAHYW
ncbi:AzlC family ABC transporter permease [Streptomyces sp. NPDC127105]|uniref:AzlC family ABC transporter permease n=1 Tax=Streptomyces sp. NPDC127105 TaxID=3345359 RepID=UPI003665FF7E